VGELLLYHHYPARTDDQIDSLVISYKAANVPVSAAVQGTVLDLN
jgi:hypothetical protein